MKNLKNALIKDSESRLNSAISDFLADLAKSPELTWIEKHTLNRKAPYKGDRTAQVKTRLTQHYNKLLASELKKLDEVSAAPDLSRDLVLTINFYKNRTWGWCPRGSDNFGHSTDSITGCGYCKESTATAQLLNQNASIMKRLYMAKDKAADQSNRDALGYGSGYGILPSFEGGVGVNCHVHILEGLGYKVTNAGNDSTTVLIISEV